MQTKLYKSLKFMDNHLTFGKVHPLAKSTTYNIRDIARIPIRLKIATGNYILQSDKATFSKKSTSPICLKNGINKLLQNLNIHKASGPDNIHGRILKECTTQIAPILTTLFSLSLKTGKIPDDWRYASVCPAFKKGDKNNPINYSRSHLHVSSANF